MIGGIAETQEVIDHCAARNITVDVELIRPDQIDRAYDRVVAKDLRYRRITGSTARVRFIEPASGKHSLDFFVSGTRRRV
jgi:alcohol dehydrogenase (NADP+)